jgi:hypothetical protein
LILANGSLSRVRAFNGMSKAIKLCLNRSGSCPCLSMITQAIGNTISE